MNAVRFFATLTTGLALACMLALPAGASSPWRRNDAGLCVRVWDPSQLARGPIAMANGVVLPLRTFSGGVQGGPAGIVLSPFAFAAGVVEGVGWFITGIPELLTGGAFAIAPEGIVHLRLDPVLMFPRGRRFFEEYEDTQQCHDEPITVESQ